MTHRWANGYVFSVLMWKCFKIGIHSTLYPSNCYCPAEHNHLIWQSTASLLLFLHVCTKPNSLLPIESWHKSFTGKFRIEITWSWLNEKRQTDDIYSWRHNGRCSDVIYECRYESVMASSVHTHSVCSRYNTVWTCHIWQVCVCDYCHWKYTNCWHKTDHVPVNVSR